MNISSINSVSNAVTATQLENSEKTTEVNKAGAATTKDIFNSKLSNIAARYDVRNISPNQALEMSKELYDAGIISESDRFLLDAQANINPYIHPEYFPDPDTPLDLLATWHEMASYQPTQDERINVQHVVDDLELVASFSSRKADSGTSSLTTQLGANVQNAIAAYKTAIDNATLDTEHVSKLLESLVSYRQSTTGADRS